MDGGHAARDRGLASFDEGFAFHGSPAPASINDATFP